MKYKLIKIFPGSPELGYIAQQDEFTCMDEFPDFWEKVKPEYPKIVSFHNGNGYIAIYDIKTDKYLYDNGLGCNLRDMLQYCLGGIYQVATSPTEIFTIGDKIYWNWVMCDSEYLTISKFYMNDDNKLVFDTKEASAQEFPIPLPISTIKHYRKSIFKTEDGIDISEGDEFWFVDIFWELGKGKCSGIYRPIKGYKTFSTEELAKEYIKQCKPEYSRNQILKAIYGLDYFMGTNLIRSEELIKKLNL